MPQIWEWMPIRLRVTGKGNSISARVQPALSASATHMVRRSNFTSMRLGRTWFCTMVATRLLESGGEVLVALTAFAGCPGSCIGPNQRMGASV